MINIHIRKLESEPWESADLLCACQATFIVT